MARPGLAIAVDLRPLADSLARSPRTCLWRSRIVTVSRRCCWLGRVRASTRCNSRVKTASICTSTNQVSLAPWSLSVCLSNQSTPVPLRMRDQLPIMHLSWLPYHRQIGWRSIARITNFYMVPSDYHLLPTYYSFMQKPQAGFLRRTDNWARKADSGGWVRDSWGGADLSGLSRSARNLRAHADGAAGSLLAQN